MINTIAQRLLLLIVAGILGLLISVGYGLYAVHAATGEAHRFNEDVVPSIETIDDATANFFQIQVGALSLLMSTDAGKISELKSSLAANRVSLDKHLVDYEKLLDDEKDRAMLNTDKATVAAYYSALEKVISLFDGGKVDEARAAVISLGSQAHAVTEALKAHVDYNHVLAEGFIAKVDGDENFGRNFQIILSIFVGGFLLFTARIAWTRIIGETGRASTEIMRVARDRDFTRPIVVSGNDEISALLRAFNQLIAELQSGFAEIRRDASILSEASAELTLAADELTRSSGVQSEASSTMAANVEEVTTSISHVADRAAQARELTDESRKLATNGANAIKSTVNGIESVARVVGEAADMMRVLDDNGRKIGAVVGVIKEVADQTNLLALNAAIEAARAGEQGRGFAVVADEVRKLAERTAASTVEITRMVESIQESAGGVATQMNRAVESVRSSVAEGAGSQAAVLEIATSSEQSATLANDIAEAMGEQTIASDQIARQVERVAQMAEENSRAAVQAKALALRLNAVSETMTKMVNTFRT